MDTITKTNFLLSNLISRTQFLMILKQLINIDMVYGFVISAFIKGVMVIEYIFN
jgi:hypothetical protein